MQLNFGRRRLGRPWRRRPGTPVAGERRRRRRRRQTGKRLVERRSHAALAPSFQGSYPTPRSLFVPARSGVHGQRVKCAHRLTQPAATAAWRCFSRRLTQSTYPAPILADPVLVRAPILSVQLRIQGSTNAGHGKQVATAPGRLRGMGKHVEAAALRQHEGRTRGLAGPGAGGRPAGTQCHLPACGSRPMIKCGDLFGPCWLQCVWRVQGPGVGPGQPAHRAWHMQPLPPARGDLFRACNGATPSFLQASTGLHYRRY